MHEQIIFSIFCILSFGFAAKRFFAISRNINLGVDWAPNSTPLEKWKNVVFIAFGQKKMFTKWLPATLHLFIYVAFIFTQIELIEILVDGISGSHRVFLPVLGSFYLFIINFIEVLSLLALIGTFIFLARRNLLKIPRFQSVELKGWPALDALIILLAEIVLVSFIFMMNTADVALHQESYQFFLSGFLVPLVQDFDTNTLHLLERVGWWGHIIVVFGFIIYLSYSKHLHIIFAFINTYYANTQPRGKIENMPAIMDEVKSLLGIAESNSDTNQLPDFGSNDVFNLSWKNILDAYTCTECGRCTEVCPANLTGKKLSPRKIMMDIRDRADEVGKKLDSGDVAFCQDKNLPLSPANFSDGLSLFSQISPEEIHACTTCNACVEACPVLINPLEPIIKMRRYEILTLSSGPADWVPLFNSLENNQAAWSLSTERSAWIADVND
ncbi:MAG: 4Fe-4S dicluster domain-containing protein [Saprospiraceae bacterium]